MQKPPVTTESIAELSAELGEPPKPETTYQLILILREDKNGNPTYYSIILPKTGDDFEEPLKYNNDNIIQTPKKAGNNFNEMIDLVVKILCKFDIKSITDVSLDCKGSIDGHKEIIRRFNIQMENEINIKLNKAHEARAASRAAAAAAAALEAETEADKEKEKEKEPESQSKPEPEPEPKNSPKEEPKKRGPKAKKSS
jgi:hypothetical protein